MVLVSRNTKQEGDFLFTRGGVPLSLCCVQYPSSLNPRSKRTLPNRNRDTNGSAHARNPRTQGASPFRRRLEAAP